MVETDPQHPSLENLIALAADRLEGSERTLLEAHLKQCSECKKSFDQLSAETFLGSADGTNSVHPAPANKGIPSGSSEAEGAHSPHDQPVVGEFAQTVYSSESEQVTSISKVPSQNEDENPADLVTHAGAEAEDEFLLSELPHELRNHQRYEALEMLGQGGMGSVFKARHRVMDRLVALKVIRPELSRPDLVERFQREIRAAGALAHPNIVTAHDAEQAGSLHFLVVEYVDGHSLDRLVAKNGRMSVGVACEYIRQAAEGLQHAFERGMVHRDIKPQNLMCTTQEVVKILDFGLAKVYSDSSASSALTNVGGMMGTPDYIAPEQADDAKQADTRSDIYSLGCTLYFLLRGEPPFPRGTLVQKLLSHVEKHPDSLQSLRNDIPDGLNEVVRCAMAKRPEDRFQSPADFGDALMEFSSMRVSRFVSDLPVGNSSPSKSDGGKGTPLDAVTFHADEEATIPPLLAESSIPTKTESALPPKVDSSPSSATPSNSTSNSEALSPGIPPAAKSTASRDMEVSQQNSLPPRSGSSSANIPASANGLGSSSVPPNQIGVAGSDPNSSPASADSSPAEIIEEVESPKHLADSSLANNEPESVGSRIAEASSGSSVPGHQPGSSVESRVEEASGSSFPNSSAQSHAGNPEAADSVDNDQVLDAIPIFDDPTKDRPLQVAFYIGLLSCLFAWIPCAGVGMLPFSAVGLGLVLYRTALTWGTGTTKFRSVTLAGFVNVLSMVFSTLSASFFGFDS